MSNNLREAPAPVQRQGARYWLSTWIPVAIGILIILGESTEAMGSDHTSGWLRPIFEHIFGHVGNRSWDYIHHIIRKGGHFLGYGFIGVAWLRAWWRSMPRSRFLTDFAFAMIGTAAMASLDEYHQSFLPNRQSSAWDVLLDCTGAFTLQCLVYLYLRLANPKRLARAK